MVKGCGMLCVLFLSLIWICEGTAGSAAGSEGLSRTSWGRFGWWETSINAANRINIDGLLSCNVTLEGLSGVIRTRSGEQWAGGPPYMTEPLKGNSRIWNVKFSGLGAGRSTIVLSRTWKFAIDPDNKGLEQGWEKPGLNDSEWRAMMVGQLEDAQYEATGAFEKEKGSGWGMQKSSSGGKSGAWENQGLPGYDGFAWYRLETVIPAEWKGEKIFFHCYGIDDEDYTYVNGTKIGQTTMKENPGAYIAERTYEIPAGIIKWGQKNTFAVRVFDDHGDGGFTGTAPELVHGRQALEAQSIKSGQAGEAPGYIKKLNWVTKWIELPDYKLTYSLATALVRVYPKGAGINLTFDAPVQHAAYVTSDGVKVASADKGLFYDSARDGQLKENWVLLWHGNAVGQNEDLPMLLVLHGKPDQISVEGAEVKVTAKRSSFDFGPPFGLRLFSGSQTEKWTSQGLPGDILEGCRFWSRASLAYPVKNTELYEVDQDRETVKFIEKYEYETIKDEWGTKPLKIAAIPPIVACLLDAGYPGKMITPRFDPGFISYAGPFAATIDSDTAVFELPIPVEDSFAGLATPGQEENLDELTRGIANLMNRWSGWDWALMGTDSGPLEQLPPGKDEPMDLDQARERALLGAYPVIGIPEGHVPGQPTTNKFTSGPLNNSIHLPAILIADERVRPGIMAALRRMTRGIDGSFSDEVFHSGIWRVEVDPTSKKPMTYYAWYRYENISDRVNGEAPYDFAATVGGVVWGIREAALWTGQWEMVRKHWHKILQVCDPYWRNHDWATAACDNKDSRPNSSVDITWDNYAGLEALARCAYGIGDLKSYDFLCYLRSRLALGTVAHEALQQYLQPVLLWPDNYFAGHLGEPYPPYRSGLLPEGSVAMEWNAPYPDGAVNQVPWRFNNANIPSPGVGLRWMAMTQPEQTRWALGRLDKYVPHYLEGQRWSGYANKPGPPFFQHDQRTIVANCLTLSYFVGEPVQQVLDKFNCLSQAPALTPFNVERMTLEHGRGQLQNLLYTRTCPMWLSTWEPRLIWEGRYDPTAGTAAIVVQPGNAPLRLKAGSRTRPLSAGINGADISERNSLKAARAEEGWYYDADRQTLHVYSKERGQIELTVRFQPDAKAPKPKPRMVPETPATALEINLLTNASFDGQLQNIARSPFAGVPTGPYLYVNRWQTVGVNLDHAGGTYTRGLIGQVGRPYRSAGLALRMYAGKDVQVIQNVAGRPGPHRLTAYVQLGRRQWDPAKVEFKIILKALAAVKGAIKELKDASLVLAPDRIKRDEWTPVVLEIDAPEGANAIQVGLSFVPLAGEGDIEKVNPVYVDDLELVRVEKLSGPTAPAISPKPVPVTKPDANLSVLWTFDEVNADLSLPDQSQHTNSAKFTGNVQLVKGRIGRALRFDGRTNAVTCGPISNVDWERGNFTVCFWINLTSTKGEGHTIFDYGGDNSKSAGVILQYRCTDGQNGKFESYLAETGAKGGFILSRGHEPKINDGQWHHIAFSVDRAGEAVTYLDDKAVYRQNISRHKNMALAGQGRARLGKGQYSQPDLEMTLDDFRVYNQALSEDQILQLIDEAGPEKHAKTS